MKVYIVLHHEIFSGERIDEMVFYVASSLKKAKELIKESGVDEWSWWEIQSYEIDEPDWPEHLGWYSTITGRRIKNPPIKQAIKAYKKGHDENGCRLS